MVAKVAGAKAGPFYVVRLQGKRPAQNRTLEQVESQLKNRLFYEKRNAALDKWVADLIVKAKVTRNDALLSEVKVEAPARSFPLTPAARRVRCGMAPVLFRIGPIPINSYGLLLVIGFGVGYFLTKAEYKRRGIDPDFAYVVFVLGLIMAMIGSRIFHVLEYLPQYRGDVGRALAGAGFSWYGGLLFAAVSTILVARAKKIHWAPFVDSVSPTLAIGYGFGRVGCYLSGDGCYGPPCAALGLNWSAPFCMAFPHGGVPTTDLVFNTPVFEIIGAIVLFSYLMFMRTRITTHALLFAQMIIIHAVMRFGIEFVRINPPLALGMSQAQWLSLACVGLGAYLIKIGPTIDVPAPAKKKSKKR